jgi:hypothetical protein
VATRTLSVHSMDGSHPAVMWFWSLSTNAPRAVQWNYQRSLVCLSFKVSPLKDKSLLIVFEATCVLAQSGWPWLSLCFMCCLSISGGRG